MNCPICGYSATRVNNSFWCPNDKIYIGQVNISPQDPFQDTNSVENPVDLEEEQSLFAKIFDKSLWIIMGILYVVVIIFVIWGFSSGIFEDTGQF